MRPPSRGFSLPELLLGFGIFLLFLGGVFGLFTKGYQAFHFLQTRQSVQGQVLRLKSVLEADFRMTHYRSIGVETDTATVDGQPARRDRACCLILDDWQSPANYRGDTGIPMWNRYALYQTSTEQEGRLQRFVVSPGGTIPLRIKPMDNLLDPGGVVGRQLLSSSIKAFACDINEYDQDIKVTFELKEVGGGRGLDQNRINETFKAVFRWTPNNTVPRF